MEAPMSCRWCLESDVLRMACPCISPESTRRRRAFACGNARSVAGIGRTRRAWWARHHHGTLQLDEMRTLKRYTQLSPEFICRQRAIMDRESKKFGVSDGV